MSLHPPLTQLMQTHKLPIFSLSFAIRYFSEPHRCYTTFSLQICDFKKLISCFKGRVISYLGCRQAEGTVVLRFTLLLETNCIRQLEKKLAQIIFEGLQPQSLIS